MFTAVFIAVASTIVKTWKQPTYPSMGEWIKEMWDINMMEGYSDLKEARGNSAICINMD